MAGDLPLVVSSGTCVGCGACRGRRAEQIEMRLTREGTYVPFAADGGELVELESEVRARAKRRCVRSPAGRAEQGSK